jgi:hypothetical protein
VLGDDELKRALADADYASLSHGIKAVVDAIAWPGSGKECDAEFILYKLRTNCANTLSFRITDTTYELVDETVALQFFNVMGLQRLVWVKDEANSVLNGAQLGDCDEFMFAAAGLANLRRGRLAFGVALNCNHAFNVIVNTSGRLRFYEPQTNTFRDVTADDDIRYVWM